MKHLILIFAVLFCHSGYAQEELGKKEYENIAAIVFLDSFVVTAKRKGFNVEEFIQLVQEDETFYQAFRNLRKISYRSENLIRFYDKKDELSTSYHSVTKQEFFDNCRTMSVEDEQIHGDFYKKNGQYRYYTAKMYDQVFFTHGKVCETIGSAEEESSPKGIQKHISELKKLIFQPGEAVDVPIIGKRTALFEEDMIRYYNYSITSTLYKNQECYVFTAQVKPEYQEKKEGKTIIKHLETYFEKSTFQVMGRKYSLRYSGALFDFDVNMEIELRKLGNIYLPEHIQYEGMWNIPTKKPEKAFFQAKFMDFQ